MEERNDLIWESSATLRDGSDLTDGELCSLNTTKPISAAPAESCCVQKTATSKFGHTEINSKFCSGGKKRNKLKIPLYILPWQQQVSTDRCSTRILTCCSLVQQILLGIMDAKPPRPHLAQPTLGTDFADRKIQSYHVASSALSTNCTEPHN